MPHNLEFPNAEGVADWDALYQARGDEVEAHRPIFTGDVFAKVEVQSIRETKTKSIMILQHPCALRTNGVDLQPRLMVAGRWVNHTSRAVIPTGTYQEVSSPAYEEADLIEEWCEDRLGADLSIHAATVEAVKWLREDSGAGVMRQQLLEDPQHRSTVRKEMRAALRILSQ